MLNCPRCKRQLPAPVAHAETMGICPSCKAPVRVEVFPAAFRPLEQGQPAASLLVDTESSCFYHPRKQAVVPCGACGRFLCALCDFEIAGQHLCPACLDNARNKDRRERLEPRRVLYDSIALDLAVVPLLLSGCLWFALPFTAAATLYICFRYWQEPGSMLSRGKGKMAAAAVLAGLQIIIVCTLLILFVSASTSGHFL